MSRAVTPIPPPPKDRWKYWPEPQTTISPNPAPIQYFPQGPKNR